VISGIFSILNLDREGENIRKKPEVKAEGKPNENKRKN
jgi:hypothetical protein